MRLRQLRQTTLALALLSAPLFAPGSTHATRSDLDGDPFTGLSASGASPDGAEFVGTIDIQAFEARDGRLVAVGTLSGQVTRVVGTVAEPIATLDAVPLEVPVGSVAATCDRLRVAFGPVPLDLHAPMVQVAPIRIDGVEQPGDGVMTESRLCALADQFRAATAPVLQAGLLDSVMHAFD